MNQSQRSASPSMAAPEAARSNAPEAEASNAMLAAQVSSAESGESTPMLDALEATTDASGGRVTGPGADLLLGSDPPWQVKGANEGRTQDTMKILKFELTDADKPPAWYKEDDRNLAHARVGNGAGEGGWVPSFEGKSGVYHCGYVDHATNQAYYFIVDYHPPEERSAQENMDRQLLDENGGITAQFVAYKAQRGLMGVVNFFNPSDNLIQWWTGQNLDPYAAITRDPVTGKITDGFGKDLTDAESKLQLVQAVAERFALGELGGLSAAQKIGLAVACVAESGGETIIGSLEQLKVIDSAAAGSARVVVKLAGLAPQFAKYHGGNAMSLSDYLGSLAALVGAGEQAVKNLLGEDGYEEFWEPNAKDIMGAYKGLSGVAVMLEGLSSPD